MSWRKFILFVNRRIIEIEEEGLTIITFYLRKEKTKTETIALYFKN